MISQGQPSELPPTYEQSMQHARPEPLYTARPHREMQIACVIFIKNHDGSSSRTRMETAPARFHLTINERTTFSSIQTVLRHEALRLCGPHRIRSGHNLFGRLMLHMKQYTSRGHSLRNEAFWSIAHEQWRWAKAKILASDEERKMSLDFHVEAVYNNSLTYRSGFSILRKLLPSMWVGSWEELFGSLMRSRKAKDCVEQDVAIMVGSQMGAS